MPKDDGPMPKDDGPPPQLFQVGQDVFVLDCGPGKVESLTPPRPGPENYAGVTYTPWNYHVRLYLKDETVERSANMIVPAAQAPPPPPPTPAQMAECRHKTILLAMQHAAGQFHVLAAAPESQMATAMAIRLAETMEKLPPHDIAMIRGVISAYETMLDHLESLKKEALT